MTGMLASVTSVEEASIVLDVGVDVIDIKNPETGALGAQSLSTVKQIARMVDGRVLTSATIGDIDPDAHNLYQCISDMATTGVDIVKVGLFDPVPSAYFVQQLQQASTNRIPIVVVLFAEYFQPGLTLPTLLETSIHGIMLDTCQKNGNSICKLLSIETMSDFVEDVHKAGMIAGLAGSLKLEDISLLLDLSADYVGFRGALCTRGLRTDDIDRDCVERVKRAVHKNLDIRCEHGRVEQTI